ncbi:MAG TPA: hypothetical protein VI299_24720 [Polyangiales bacterium]
MKKSIWYIAASLSLGAGLLAADLPSALAAAGETCVTAGPLPATVSRVAAYPGNTCPIKLNATEGKVILNAIGGTLDVTKTDGKGFVSSGALLCENGKISLGGKNGTNLTNGDIRLYCPLFVKGYQMIGQLGS